MEEPLQTKVDICLHFDIGFGVHIICTYQFVKYICHIFEDSESQNSQSLQLLE